MKKFMFLVQRRGGGTLFNRLLAQIGDDDPAGKLPGDRKPGDRTFMRTTLLPTKETCTFYSLYSKVPEILTAKNYPLDQHCAFSMYAENWWGDTDPDVAAQPLWGPQNLEKWCPADSWKVVSLVRDGRNQVTSRLIGDYKAKNQIGDLSTTQETIEAALSNIPEFIKKCKHWNKRINLNLLNRDQYEHYTLLKFEDMIRDPYSFLSDTLSDIGLTPELENKVSLENNTTSTWSDKSDQNQRYSYWTEEHIKLCKDIMSENLKKLNYSGTGIS